MSKFHEGIKDILQDMVDFLMLALDKESLHSESIHQKDLILKKINTFLNLYPNMNIKIPVPTKIDKKETAPPFPNLANLLADDDNGNYAPSYLDMGSPKSTSIFEEEYEIPEKQNETHAGSSIASDGDSFISSPTSTDLRVLESEETPISADEGVSDIDLQGVLKSGYLEKKRKEQTLLLKFHPFQKRWCVIRDHLFNYYDKETDRKPKGQFSLAGYEANPLPSTTKDSIKRNMSFELVNPGKRAFQFVATSVNDMKEWITAVEEARKRAPEDVKKPSICLLNVNNTNQSFDVEVEEEDENIYEPLEESDENDEFYADGESLQPDDIYDEGESLPQWNNKCKNSPNKTKQDPFEIVEAFNIKLDYDNWYSCQWDCTAGEENELSFSHGDLIHIINKDYDTNSWWVGEINGKVGFVPKNYLIKAYELIED